MVTPETVLAELATLGIAHDVLQHPPIHTVEAARAHWARLPGEGAKNLLLKDAGGQFWLVVAPAEAALDLKALPKRIGSKRLSFAGAADLEATLAVERGAVTPLAVVNDAAGRVTVVLDRSLAGEARVLVHPLVNTATIALAGWDLVRFLALHGHEPLVVALDGAD